MQPAQNFLVSTEWLAARLGDPNTAIVDASWYLPAENRDPKAEFASAHIPGAVFFDIDAIADQNTHLPHMLPEEEEFAKAAGALGISHDQTIVVYDGSGLFSAPRVWWTFRIFGAEKVYILDGGLPHWRQEGRPVESGKPRPSAKTFDARLEHGGVRHFDHVREHLDTGSAQVVDARSSDRFHGKLPEIRPGVESGHMPGSKNLPHTNLVENGKLKSPAELAAEFAKAGVDLTRPVVMSCGSGVSAALLHLAAETLGAHKVALYDGSWTDWGSRKDTPKTRTVNP